MLRLMTARLEMDAQFQLCMFREKVAWACCNSFSEACDM